MTFVTAIYNNNQTSIIGGRGRDLNFYKSSLKNIANLGYPIIIYTAPEDVENTESSLKEYFTSGLKVIPYKLEDFKYFQKFIEWKANNVNIEKINNDRNEVLCFSKIYWLKNATELNPFNSETFFWIDAGLTHHGIFPEATGGVELMTNPPSLVYYPLNENNIFCPQLGQNLKNKIKDDKMFFCSTPWQGGSEEHLSFLKKYFNIEPENIIFNKHLVAGIFGGKISTINSFLEKFDFFLDKFIDENIRCFEEQVYSTIIHAYPELFDLEHFYTWYFYSPGERCSYLKEEGDSFYKIFVRIKNG